VDRSSALVTTRLWLQPISRTNNTSDSKSIDRRRLRALKVGESMAFPELKEWDLFSLTPSLLYGI